MKVILIDDHGDTRLIENTPYDPSIGEVENPVLEAAKEYFFQPCGECGEVGFADDWNAEEDCCKYCVGK
jgi:hypothetical protein